MGLSQKINDDLKEAMKSSDAFRLGTLRLLSAALHNREIEKKTKSGELVLTEEEVLEVLTREAKKRKEAAGIYEKGSRQDLADKEKKELKIISAYLPEQLGIGEIEKVVEEIMKRTGINIQKDPEEKSAVSNGANFGRVMGEIMKELKGRADASAVSAILKKKLGD